MEPEEKDWEWDIDCPGTGEVVLDGDDEEEDEAEEVNASLSFLVLGEDLLNMIDSFTCTLLDEQTNPRIGEHFFAIDRYDAE